MSRLPNFYKGLTSELLKKAEEELNETPQVRSEALKKFKKLIKEQKIICNMDDQFLLRFLRVKKFNVEKSLKVLRNYITLLQKYSGIFTHRLPSELKNILDMNLLHFQPYRLDDYSHIVIVRLGKFDQNNGVVEDLIAYNWIWSVISIEYEVSQISGVHIILDLSDTTFYHYKSVFSFSSLKFQLCALQDGFPMRVRGIHIVHEPHLAHSVFKVFKIFGTKKLTEKMHFYGNDLSRLHKYVSKECLPQWLGGTMSPIDNEEFASVFYSYEGLIEIMKSYKIIDSNS